MKEFVDALCLVLGNFWIRVFKNLIGSSCWGGLWLFTLWQYLWNKKVYGNIKWKVDRQSSVFLIVLAATTRCWATEGVFFISNISLICVHFNIFFLFVLNLVVSSLMQAAYISCWLYPWCMTLTTFSVSRVINGVLIINLVRVKMCLPTAQVF